MLRVVAIAFFILLIAVGILATQGINTAAPLGTVTLTPVAGSQTRGTVYLNAGDHHVTFANVQASGMGPLATDGFALMDTKCTTVRQMLNPIESTVAGDGSDSSVINTRPTGDWGFGILSGTSSHSHVIACGSLSQPSQPAPAATPTTSGGQGSGPGTLVPVNPATPLPTVNLEQTPTPVGS
jgi:hypothetical protein